MAPDTTKAGQSGLTQHHPAVSVVVPCFNGGRFLDTLMASLARQTFRDFEIVIVDDGSTDLETLRKLSELEGRARVIHREKWRPVGGAEFRNSLCACRARCCRSTVTTRSRRHFWTRRSR